MNRYDRPGCHEFSIIARWRHTPHFTSHKHQIGHIACQYKRNFVYKMNDGYHRTRTYYYTQTLSCTNIERRGKKKKKTIPRTTTGNSNTSILLLSMVVLLTFFFSSHIQLCRYFFFFLINGENRVKYFNSDRPSTQQNLN